MIISGYNGQNVQIFPHQGSPSDVSAPAANAAAIVTYGGAANQTNLLNGVGWSYSGSGTLAGGNLTILDGPGNVVFNLDITVAGPGFMQFTSPLTGTPGNQMQIVLAAGGANVSGKLSILGFQAIQGNPPGAKLIPSFIFNIAPPTQPNDTQYLSLL